MTWSRPERSCSAWLVLLMSSLVQAKCTNSAAFFQLGAGFELALDPVFHGLHVVVGGLLDFLMAAESASEKFSPGSASKRVLR